MKGRAAARSGYKPAAVEVLPVLARSLFPCFLVALLVATPLRARAANDQLTAGRSAYEEGEYGKARLLLGQLVESRSLSPDDLRLARTYLAAAHYFFGDIPAARRQMQALFCQNAFARVDPVVFPPEVVRLSTEVLKDLEAHDSCERPKPPPTPAPEPAKPAASTSPTPAPAAATSPAEPPRTPAPLALAFMPFGVGQFANGDYGKGAAFLVLGTGALATFATFELLAEQQKGASEKNVPFIQYDAATLRDPEAFRRDTIVYTVAFWSGVGIWGIGIVDALICRPDAPATGTPPQALKLGTSLGGVAATAQFSPGALTLRF